MHEIRHSHDHQNSKIKNKICAIPTHLLYFFKRVRRRSNSDSSQAASIVRQQAYRQQPTTVLFRGTQKLNTKRFGGMTLQATDDSSGRSVRTFSGRRVCAQLFTFYRQRCADARARKRVRLQRIFEMTPVIGGRTTSWPTFDNPW